MSDYKTLEQSGCVRVTCRACGLEQWHRVEMKFRCNQCRFEDYVRILSGESNAHDFQGDGVA